LISDNIWLKSQAVESGGGGDFFLNLNVCEVSSDTTALKTEVLMLTLQNLRMSG
jgi:hypothetical protein